MRWFLLPLVLATACGGETGSEPGSSSGGSSTGGASTGGASTGGSPSGGSGGLSLGGSSSGGSATGGAPSCGPIDTGAPCSTLVEAQCLATHPRCVPLYDDQCCPICDLTAPCADCVDKKFIGCTEFELSICTPGAVGPCGMTPNWACTGGVASCPTSEPCNTEPGCVAATSSPCTPEGCEIECHPLTRYSCFEPCATTEKPSCQASTREGTESGYSGYCIPNEACGCPALAPKSGSACTLEGFSCNYGQCLPRCRCDGSVWSCISDLC